MENSLATTGRKILACACSLALGAALVPAAALAADNNKTNDPIVLKLQLQDEKTGATVRLKAKEFTQAALDKLANENTSTVSYLYGGSSGASVISTSSYVKLSQLMDGIDKWNEKSYLTFSTSSTDESGTTSTVPYTKANITYEEATQERYFYPDYSTDADFSKSIAVEPVVALKLTSSKKIASGTAGDLVESFNDDSYGTSDAPRFLMGSPEKELIQGRYFPTNVATITIVYPHEDFQVIAKNADTGTTTTIATYSDEQLAELAKANTKTMNFILGSGVYTTDEYVTVSQLLGDSVYWQKNSTATFTAPDGFSYELSYEDATAKQYFYPEYTREEASDYRQVGVEPVVALSGRTGDLLENGTAEDSLNAENLKTDTGMPRFFKGNTDVNKLLQGKTSPQVITSVTIKYSSDEIEAVLNNKVESLESELETAKAEAAEAAKTAESNILAKTDEVKKLQAELAAAKTALAKTVKSVTVNTKTVDAAAISAAIAKAGGDVKYVTSITLGKNVKAIKANAFKGTNVKTVTVKTKKLTKKSVKNSLKSSKVTTVKVDVSKKKATDKKYVTKYKKIFTKSNAGKKVTVKA